MLSYLEKYNQLPTDLKDAVTSPQAMAAVGELEKTYSVSLAIVVIRVMVKDISILDLPKYFVFEYNLDGKQAEALTEALKARVFAPVAVHLGFTLDATVKDEAQLEDWLQNRQSETAIRGSSFFFSPEDEEEVRALAQSATVHHQEIAIKKVQDDTKLKAAVATVAGALKINFSSADLRTRYAQIIETYLRGVRNKIETKQALMKDVEAGGVALNTDFANKTIAAADALRDTPVDANNTQNDATRLQADDTVERINDAQARPGVSAATLLGAERDVAYDFSALKAPLAPAITKVTAPSTPIPATTPPPPPMPRRSSVAPAPSPVRTPAAPAPVRIPPPPVPSPAQPAGREPVIDLKNAKEISPNDVREHQVNTANVTAAPMAARPESTIDMAKMNAILHTPFVMPTGPASARPAVPDLRRPPAASAPVSAAAPLDLGKVMQAAKQNEGNVAAPDGNGIGKVRVADVKYVPKLTGPIEELRDMDLITFRRLGGDATSAVNRIKEKIGFLEEDSYAKRLAGIKAWRESPINKLYLALGAASIGQGQPIDAILEAKAAAGEEALNRDEFTAIMNLNRDLRF